MRRSTFVLIPALILIPLIAFQAMAIMPEGQQGVVVQFGRPVRTLRDPGLYWKAPFIQSVVAFPKATLSYNVPAGDYPTLERRTMVVDQVIRWRIEDPLQFLTSIGSPDQANILLADIATAQLRLEMASRSFDDIVSKEREAIMEGVALRTREAFLPRGVYIIDSRFNRFDLPADVQSSLISNLRAERKAVADGLRAEGREQATQVQASADKERQSVNSVAQETAAATKASADKERQIALATAYAKAQTLRGEGDALATQVMGEAFGQDAEFYAFQRRLENLQFILGAGATLVVRPDSELLRYLDGPGSPAP